MAQNYKVETYLILAKSGTTWGKARVVRACAKAPGLSKGEIAIKVKLDIPHSSFEDFVPTVSITLPDVADSKIKAEADWNF